jgi:hypothetical protein
MFKSFVFDVSIASIVLGKGALSINNLHQPDPPHSAILA